MIIFKWAKIIRNNKVLPYIGEHDYHLDVGSGNGYLLERSPARWWNKLGIPEKAETLLPTLDRLYSKITLIAVLEHVDNVEKVLNGCLGLLSDGGKIIITTPTWLGDKLHWFLTRFMNGSYEDHKRVVSYKYLRSLIPDEYNIHHEIWEWGLNQLFIIERRKR